MAVTTAEAAPDQVWSDMIAKVVEMIEKLKAANVLLHGK